MRKIRAVFTVLFNDNLNYRAQAVVWIMTSIVPTVTTGAVWLASFGSADKLGFFSRGSIIAYFFGSILLSNIVTSSIAFDMGQEIKDGKLSFYLVRPLGYPMYQFLANLSWRFFRTLMFLPFLVIVLIFIGRYVTGTSLHIDGVFILFVILAHLLSFLISFTIGSFALFLEDMSSIGQAYMLINILFSGQIAPLALMPHGLQAAANALPFRYTLSMPLEYMVGTTTDVTKPLLLAVLWIVVFFVISQSIFALGLRKYSAVGQ